MNNSPSNEAALQLASTKRTAWSAVHALASPDFSATASKHLSADCQWVASHPVNALRGCAAIVDQYLAPLHRALPDLERRDDLFFAGWWDGRIDGGAGWWATATGHYVGTLCAPLFGIPARGETVWLRFGEFLRVEGRRVVEGRVLLDLVDLARQVGTPVLPAPSGREVLVPGPAGHAGLQHDAADAQRSAASLGLVEAMIGGLGRYNRQDLQSMGMARYWHPQMMWYGPGGIGTCRSIEGFERHHQKPFLVALPDRKGGHHRTRFAEGDFVASTGWPSVRATHAGPYLGEPASGRMVGLRVMDWWRAEGDLLRENWVLLDLPDLFMQVGLDILARARS